MACVVACIASFPRATTEPPVAQRPSTTPPAPVAVPDRPVLTDSLLVTWYGNPRTARMGILGRYNGAQLAAKLREQADAYQKLTTKKVLIAYHLVAVIAQPFAGKDGMWRRRETHETIDALLAGARANKFKLILDVQTGHSTVKSELQYLRRHLEDPDVYLALDPEFAMQEGIAPGQKIGRMTAEDVNTAISVLEGIVRERCLPRKILMVHQFTMAMLANKDQIRDSSAVDVVLDMDGFGDRPLKRAIYTMVNRRPLQFPAIKLFYKEDTNLFAPSDVMALKPEPAAIVYQ